MLLQLLYELKTDTDYRVQTSRGHTVKQKLCLPNQIIHWYFYTNDENTTEVEGKDTNEFR